MSVRVGVLCGLLLLFIHYNTVQANQCTDDPNYKFNGRTDLTCMWAAEDTTNRCNEVDEDYVGVRDRCRKTCNNCWPTMSMGHATGQWCTDGTQCSSGVCQQNTCYASEHCRALKQPWGGTFERDKVVLVFVGSGFTDRYIWQQQAKSTFDIMSKYEMFEYTNMRFNVFYVDLLEENFCNFGCRGIDTLLCCENERAKSLANKCFPSQATLHTIVIHNDIRYGGAGYREANIATTSTHPDSGYVAVHELGHALFELGDEYPTGVFNAANSANCDYSGCPKWADLADHMGKELCKPQSCMGGEYFAGELSFMDDLKAPVGDVNLRYTCCTYLALTKGIPSYCDKFEFGDGLINYCQKDYQGYGGVAFYQRLYNTRQTAAEYASSFRANYLYVARPAVIHIDVEQETFAYEDQQNRYGNEPAIHRRRQMLGDYYDILAASGLGVDKILKVAVKFDSGEEQNMLFNPSINIEPPPSENELVIIAIGNDTISTMEIVVDGSKGLVTDVEVEYINITWWTVMKNWFARIWQSLAAFFT